jgi:putative tryptophan/tyrosine transport system substrate-binding protein
MRRILLALLCAVGLASPAAADEPPYAAWFRHGPEVRQAWRIDAVPGDALQVAIRRKIPSDMPERRVVMLYARASSAYDVAITKLLEVFEEKGLNVRIDVLNYNNDEARAAQALRQADGADTHLILSMGSETTALLHQTYRGGKIPVVTVCSKDPVELGQMPGYETGSGSNIAFTSLNTPIDVQMAYLLQLKSRLQNIAILVDEKNVSAMQTQALPMVREAERRGIRALLVSVERRRAAREELSRLVPGAVATMRKNDPLLDNSLFWITGSTYVFNEIATINEHADRVPVLSAVPEVVRAGGDSAVLSIGVSFESNAYLAAVYASDVLLGRARPGELKVGIVSPPDIAINFRKAREIGMAVPFAFFESAAHVYDYEGIAVRSNGRAVAGIRMGRVGTVR